MKTQAETSDAGNRLRIGAFFVAGLLLVLVGIWILTSGTSPNADSANAGAVAEGPRLTLASSVLHFGRIEHTERLEESVTFRNTGDRDLVIEHVESS